MRIGRWLAHAIFDAPRHRRASEVAAWSNALASVGVAGGVYFLWRSWPAALGVAALTFVLLRAALAHRLTVWLAAAVGTLAVAATGGAVAWLFAHVVDLEAAPPIGAGAGAVVSAILPSWAYGQLAQRRLEGVRDSLLAPAPSSGNP